MDILRCVPTAGLLKVIQANSPNILQHDQIETLWQRFCKKEFNFALKEKIVMHKKEFGDLSCFPAGSWEETYDMLACEEFLRLQSDTAKLASRTMQLNQEKTMKQTTLLADPRMLAKARGKAGPGARGNSARGPRNAVQRAAEETRQWVLQRKQAIASASKPPTKIDVPPKGSQDAIRNRVIKAPANKIRQKPALDGVRDKKQDKAQMPSATPSSAGLTNSGDANQSAASTAPLLMTPKKPAPARTGGGMFAGSKLWVAKGMPPTETKKITRHSNGTVTISASIDWTEPRNKQILESYTPAEKAAALSKPATTATVPAAEYKKRGSNAISSDDNDTTSVSSSAASPSVDGDNTRPLAPIKRRKVAPSLFMSPKTTARPRTQD